MCIFEPGGCERARRLSRSAPGWECNGQQYNAERTWLARRGSQLRGPTISADLAVMAGRQGLETLGYLLEMARLEAESAKRNNGANAPR